MENPTNGGLDINKGGYVCHHLLENPDDYDVYRQFTGIGRAYNLICNHCIKDLERLADVLREISTDGFEGIDEYDEGFIGLPEVLERPSSLHFVHDIITLQLPLHANILSMKPQYGTGQSTWIAMLSSAEIIQVDLSKGIVKHLGDMPSTALTLSENVALHLAPDNRSVAVVHDRASLGVVFDLVAERITMKLDRGSYHPEQTPFPIAFFQSEGRTLLIHGTDWNRLDISDPQTGELLTARNPTAYRHGETRPEHYLDYFHALPVISPTGEWVAEEGWIWQPFAATRLWNLHRWLNENIWESEDGLSVKRLRQTGYDWNTPLCWIDNQTLALWGFGGFDATVPAVQLFDAPTAKRLGWFAGPKEGSLYFDEYLFSTSTEGTEVWDIATGERLLHDSDLIPIQYHQETQQFLSILPDSRFQLSRLEE